MFRRYPISGLGFSELDSWNIWNVEQVRKSTWGRIYLLCVCDSEGSGSELNNLTGTESFLGDGRTQGTLFQESLTDNIQTLYSDYYHFLPEMATRRYLTDLTWKRTVLQINNSNCLLLLCLFFPFFSHIKNLRR